MNVYRTARDASASGPTSRRALPAACLLVAATALSACHRENPQTMLGTLEWDRVAVAAEVSEPILRIDMKEGATAHAGDAILSLDPRRTDAALAQAVADAAHAQAALAELRHGTRVETIDAARATLAGAESMQVNAKRERDRRAEMRKRGLIAQADLDNAETALRTTTAQSNNARRESQRNASTARASRTSSRPRRSSHPRKPRPSI